MTTYISILRGVNVGGKSVKMDALRKSYDNLGFRNVRTYVQSGNVIFTAEKGEPDKMEEIISHAIKKDFGFEVPVLVMTVDKLKQIIRDNPLQTDPAKDPSFLHVTFLASKPKPYDRKPMEDKRQNGEDIIFSDDVIYLYCPNGYGRTKLSNNFLEAKLKVPATTRNWKTTNNLLKMAQEAF